MNGADLVARLKEERDRHVIGFPGPRRNVAELLDNALDRLEALEAWKAEAMEALRLLADAADANDDAGQDDPDEDRIWIVQAYGCRIADITIDELRAARRLVEKEDGRHG